MSFATSSISRATKKLAAACALVVALAGASAAVAPQTAYADSPTYTMSVTGDSSSIAPGDTFTVSLDLSNNESGSYTMYAMSATVRYNTSMLEVVSMDMNNGIDVYTADAGDGWTQAVLNFKARTLKGITWNNGSLMNITFKALEQGSTAMMITRVNISNSTGMGSYACTCNDAVITVSESGGSGVAPSDDESEGSTGGVEAPEADPSELTDDGDEMTEEEKAEYEATKNGELGAESASSASASSAASSSSSAATAGSMSDGGSGASADDDSAILYVLVGCFVAAVVILAVGVVVHKRRSK